MNNSRLTTRTLVFNNNKLLLVKNNDANFWYPPGGGMEETDKNLLACAEREVYEETGLKVTVTALAWMREFYDEQKQQMNLETYWIAKLKSKAELDVGHRDLDEMGEVEVVGWFSEQEARAMTVYPKIIQERKFKEIENLSNRYLFH